MKKFWTVVLIIVAVAACGYVAAKLYANKKAKDMVDESIEKLQPMVMVEYDSVSADPFTRSMAVEDIMIKSPMLTSPIPVGAFRVHKWSADEDGSRAAHVAIEKIKVDTNQKVLENQAQQLAQLGYEGQFEINFEMDYDYDADDKTLDVKAFRLGIPTVGSVDFQMKMEGIDPAAMQGNLMQSGFQPGANPLPGVMLAGATLKLQNEGLAEQLFLAQAQKQNISLEQWKKQEVDALDQYMNTLDDRQLRDIVKALRNFIAKPGALTITIDPEKPVSVDKLMNSQDPIQVVKELKLEAHS